jgi:peptidoglycan hydrolase-like protein with peptidoglycan-binding domain
MKTKSVLSAILVGGALGLATSPVWSQEAPGETRQPYPELNRPGEVEEDIPGTHGGGTQELSKSDMKNVEQALESEGYNPGRIDGRADDDARAAIRDFQQDEGLPMTGMIDRRTAEELNVASRSGSSDSKSERFGERPDS